MEQVAIYTRFFTDGLDKLAEELKRFANEEEIWNVTGDISNSAGNLTLHLVGNLNHFIGAQLGKTGYVRNRDNEFVSRNVHRDVLLKMIAETKTMVEKALEGVKEEDLETIYVVHPFEDRTILWVLVNLLQHFNYHLGQINYLRRIFSPKAL